MSYDIPGLSPFTAEVDQLLDVKGRESHNAWLLLTIDKEKMKGKSLDLSTVSRMFLIDSQPD